MTDKERSKQAKDYLMQISKIDRLITRLTNTVATLRSSLTSGNYELKRDVVQTSGPKNPIESTMIKIIDLEKQINDRIDELILRKTDAINKIELIPDLDQQTLLIARYVDNMKWPQIAESMNYSLPNIYKIHGKALLTFSENNPNLSV